jgi:hypothetical protein
MINMLKSCLVVGTSNTIVKGGWFDGFSNSTAAQVDRIALGGAPFTQFFSRLHSVDLTVYDLVVLECSPNDEAYPDNVGFSWYFDTLYHGLLSRILHSTKLIVLRVPGLRNIIQPSDTWLRQKRIAEGLGVPVVDLSSDLLAGCDDRGVVALYRDQYHPLTDLLHQAGVNFAKRLGSIDLSSTLVVQPPFDIYTQRVVSKNSVELSNSLISERFELLSLGESFKFTHPGFCIGFFIAAETAWGCLKLHGIDDEVKHLFVLYESDKNANQMKFVPIKNGFYLKALSIIQPYKIVDYSLHSDVPLDGDNKIAFGDFVFLDSF